VGQKKWQNRAAFIGITAILLSISLIIIFKVFNENIVFYFSPTELKSAKNSSGLIRVGGLVKDDSISYADNKETLSFIITDLESELTIHYKGIIPNLFKEGQGTVVLGKLDENGIFQASELLAKHDENYMPPEVAKSIKKSGQWRDPQ
jgi:cytochrome c-type biogenesis protein CcmE